MHAKNVTQLMGIPRKRDCGAGVEWRGKDTISAGKQGPSCEELSHYAAHRPDVHYNTKQKPSSHSLKQNTSVKDKIFTFLKG